MFVCRWVCGCVCVGTKIQIAAYDFAISPVEENIPVRS